MKAPQKTKATGKMVTATCGIVQHCHLGKSKPSVRRFANEAGSFPASLANEEAMSVVSRVDI
jgi:hypothetical protein